MFGELLCGAILSGGVFSDGNLIRLQQVGVGVKQVLQHSMATSRSLTLSESGHGHRLVEGKALFLGQRFRKVAIDLHTQVVEILLHIVSEDAVGLASCAGSADEDRKGDDEDLLEHLYFTRSPVAFSNLPFEFALAPRRLQDEQLTLYTASSPSPQSMSEERPEQSHCRTAQQSQSRHEEQIFSLDHLSGLEYTQSICCQKAGQEEACHKQCRASQVHGIEADTRGFVRIFCFVCLLTWRVCGSTELDDTHIESGQTFTAESNARDKMRDDCPDLTQKEIGRYKGKWDKLQMPIESIVTVGLDADLNVFFSCKWYKMEFVNVWYKYVGDERVTALLEHFRDMSLSLYPEPAKRFWDRVDLEGLCEDGVNPNCRGVITPIELTAEDIEAMREDPRWSQGQQLNEEV